MIKEIEKPINLKITTISDSPIKGITVSLTTIKTGDIRFIDIKLGLWTWCLYVRVRS